MRDLRRSQRRLVTTEFILLEVADALALPAIRGETIGFINGLRQQATMVVIPVSPDLFTAGWALYCQRLDQEWGLTDCISFAVMTERQITDAFTSDHHFEQAGFHKLL